ncbi:MAG: DNA topoisomerase VI, partial [Candidatus Diapherotrites archaeon]|nr:DNA topoisomerase VI [Candidatus Diapherotrites archaeon]
MAAKKTTKNKKEIQTAKEIAKGIENMASRITKEINSHKDPTFTTQQRGRNNVIFDEKNRVLALGDKITSRNFLNIGHAKKFMQTMMVSAKTHNYLKENKTASIREVYYELKHTLGKTKENTFEDQTESDSCIVDLEHSVNTIREKLSLHANPKGTLYGDITLRDKKHNNDEFNASKLG